jgi:small neutral amino acid transporter SnatA (MarC family)
MSEVEKRRTIWKASVSFVVLSLFILAGRFILAFFGISRDRSISPRYALLFDIHRPAFRQQATKTSKEGSDRIPRVAVFPWPFP